MVDCSRNGVLLVSAIKDLLRNLAMMGCNMVQLYTEVRDCSAVKDKTELRPRIRTRCSARWRLP
jgi:hypothetical protein